MTAVSIPLRRTMWRASSGGRELAVSRSQDDLTKGDGPCLRTRGDFRLLLCRRLLNSSRHSVRPGRRDGAGGEGYRCGRTHTRRTGPRRSSCHLAGRSRAVSTLEARVGSAEPLFLASAWTKVTARREIPAHGAPVSGRGWLHEGTDTTPDIGASDRARGPGTGVRDAMMGCGRTRPDCSEARPRRGGWAVPIRHGRCPGCATAGSVTTRRRRGR
jgi:hypothetical protein